MRLTWETLTLSLLEPFVSHKGATESIRHELVEIAWEGRVGLGIAVPAKEYGMTNASVRAAFAEIAPLIEGAAPAQLETLIRRCERVVPGQPAAIAAVDMALHDLLGQLSGLPLHALLGLAGLPLPPTAVSIGMAAPRVVAAKARQLSAWPIVKLKMSAPDEELLRAVRGEYPGRIWIDGNGAWAKEDAVRWAERLATFGVELLEQPVPRGAPEALRFVHERSPVLVLADEECVGPADVPRLQGCAGGVNVKLLKCGGIRRAMETALVARRLGLKVMLGCKTESALGITAVAHLGGLADFLDVDGHLDVVADPFEGLTVEEGRVKLPARPGLGIRRRA